MLYSKVHPARHNIVNRIKPGRSSETTDKHATKCSKAVFFWRNVICVRCIHGSYNNIAKRIRLHDKITIFLLIQETFHTSKSF